MDHIVQDWFQPPLLVDHPQLRISTTHQSAHPASAFDSGSLRNVGVYVLCWLWASPQLRPSNMSVNHALLVRWSSVKGCLADMTYTEHACGLHPL